MWKSREPQAVYGNPNHVLVREATPTPIGRQRGLCHRLIFASFVPSARTAVSHLPAR
jgi:hypothetical protein